MTLQRFIPANLAHAIAPSVVKIAAELLGNDEAETWQPLDWRGLHFPNRLGVAAGVDKDVDQVLAWQRLGAGFIEVGTITPKPQLPNPGKILDRDWDGQGLWNQMGFPSDGAPNAALSLGELHSELKIPVFVNIGKNRATPNEQAAQDYVEVIRSFPFARAFVVNVSSPNTAGLRQLQGAEHLLPLCTQITHAAVPRPVFLKLSPDLTESEIKTSIDAALDGGIAGFVLTNTTLARTKNSPFPPTGGVSGAELTKLSRQCLQWARSVAENSLLISVGGILDADEVKRRFDLGADLVEFYSALVFKGPLFFRQMKRAFTENFPSK